MALFACDLLGADENCICPENTYAGEDEWGPLCIPIDTDPCADFPESVWNGTHCVEHIIIDYNCTDLVWGSVYNEFN